MAALTLKAMAEDKENSDFKKKTTFQANPLAIGEITGYNKRNYEDPEVEAQIEAFAQSYEKGVFVPSWIVWVHEDGTVAVLEGHLRRRGVRRAIERGTEIPFVSVEAFKGTWSEAIQLMLLSQDGLKFKPLEFALGVLDLKNEGHSNQEIAPMVKRTSARVEQLLILAEAPPEVHELVRDGKVDAEAAILVLREHKDKALAVLQGLVDGVSQQGGGKVNRSTLRGPSLPPKIVTSVVESVESVVSNLAGSARKLLAEFETLSPEQLKGKVVEVDAGSLLALLKAQGEVLDLKAKRAASVAAKQAAASQQELDVGAAQDGAGEAGAAPVNTVPDKPVSTLTPEEINKLRIYGGTTLVEGANVRTIVSAFTQKDAARLLGLPLSHIRGMWVETDNPKEVEAARQHPEQVLVASSVNGADFAVRA